MVHEGLAKLCNTKRFVSRGKEALVSTAPIVALGALCLLTVTQSNPAKAATSLQSFSLTDTFTAFPAASATGAVQDFIIPQFTVLPFDTNLGTLTSTTVVWATTASFSGTTGSADPQGLVQLDFAGNTSVNTTSYSGFSGGNGTGAGSNLPISVNLASFGITNIFLPATADATIQAAFIGPNPYTIEWSNNGSSPNTLDYTNIASGSASFTTTASVTYDYLADVPAPLPLLGVGAAWTWSRRLRRRCAQRRD